MGGEIAFGGNNKAGDGGFHVGGATGVEFAIVFGGFKGGECPFGFIACGDDVGVPRKTQHGGLAADAGIEIFGVAVVVPFYFETERDKPCGDNVLAAVVVGRDAGLGEQLFGKGDGHGGLSGGMV